VRWARQLYDGDWRVAFERRMQLPPTFALLVDRVYDATCRLCSDDGTSTPVDVVEEGDGPLDEVRITRDHWKSDGSVSDGVSSRELDSADGAGAGAVSSCTTCSAWGCCARTRRTRN